MDKFIAHILVVDDDDGIRSLVKKFLNENKFLVTTAENAENALEKIKIIKFDLIVLDIMMPGKSGLEFIKENKKRLETPVILLTAKGEANERVEGLEIGADDYLPKPFEPKELLLRINAILRRVPHKTATETVPHMLSIGATRYYVRKGELWKGEIQVRLTGTEAVLMRIFAENIDQPLRRVDLVKKMGKLNGISHDRSIDVQIARLRRKIEQNPKEPRYLQTVRGLGYLLSSD